MGPQPGGLGASIQGDFSVTPGEILSVLVGGHGVDSNASGAGGGGGSFVWRGSNFASLANPANLLVAAGAGGGAGTSSEVGPGTNAQTTQAGTNGNGPTGGGAGGTNGAGGSGGDSNSTSASGGGGGGGINSSGSQGESGIITTGGGGGNAIIAGGEGGTGGTGDANGTNGGFGGAGGGGGSSIAASQGGAGGGSGFSGGGGGSSGGIAGIVGGGGGGGGGSLNAGTNQINTAGVSTDDGDGRVEITTFPNSCPPPQPTRPQPTDCIRTQKVFDWVTISNEECKVITIPDDCLTSVRAALAQGNDVHVSVKCLNTPDSSSHSSKPQPLPRPGEVRCQVCTLQRINNHRDKDSDQLAKVNLLQVIPLEVIICDNTTHQELCHFCHSVILPETVVLCVPEPLNKDNISCDLFDIKCETFECIIDENQINVIIRVCNDIQVKAEVKLCIAAKPCQPRKPIKASHVFNCQTIELPE